MVRCSSMLALRAAAAAAAALTLHLQVASVMAFSVSRHAHSRAPSQRLIINNAISFQIQTYPRTSITGPARCGHTSHFATVSSRRANSNSYSEHGHDADDDRSVIISLASQLRRFIASATLVFGIAFATLPKMAPPAYASIPPGATTAVVEKIAPAKPCGPVVIEEVWGLVNKFYIDRTFNNQDWNQIHDKYIALAMANSDNDSTMKFITQMVQSLSDRYSRVLSVDAYAAIQKYDLIGVGVTLMPNAQRQIIVGAPPIQNSPSDKAGLIAGDRITAVNGESTKGRTAFDIIDQISDVPNAKTVTFTVQRSNLPELFDVIMERQNLQDVKDPVTYKVTERRPDGTVVGYIRLSEFNSLVKSRLEDALADLKNKEGANAFVLDLRRNTGGAFQSAVEISGLFVEDRVATYVVDSNQVELPFRTFKGKLAVPADAPLVIWLDGRSASASEVLAGSLHDNCRAVTMGEKSYGKGLIQAVYGLKNGAGLVLTVARYVTPSGSDIQGVGITPDIPGNVPPAVPLLPTLPSDTAKVDFNDVRTRTSMCKLPSERVGKGIVTKQVVTMEEAEGR